jgi:hypothetical protein
VHAPAGHGGLEVNKASEAAPRLDLSCRERSALLRPRLGLSSAVLHTLGVLLRGRCGQSTYITDPGSSPRATESDDAWPARGAHRPRRLPDRASGRQLCLGGEALEAAALALESLGVDALFLNYLNPAPPLSQTNGGGVQTKSISVVRAADQDLPPSASDPSAALPSGRGCVPASFVPRASCELGSALAADANRPPGALSTDAAGTRAAAAGPRGEVAETPARQVCGWGFHPEAPPGPFLHALEAAGLFKSETQRLREVRTRGFLLRVGAWPWMRWCKYLLCSSFVCFLHVLHANVHPL